VIRVLVVDDDFMVARIHARFVERTDGFEVVGTAHTGADALELAAQPLEHFVDTGAAEVRLRYGGSGRPERRYRIER
jgi:response regulator of citrate/malate metabolism